jgi:sugar phosphate isomerase/epimerase
MKLGFVSAIVPELSLEQVLTLARDEGFGCVEVMCWPVGKAERKYAGVTHIDVADFTRAEADDVNALCAEYGVSISGLGYYPNPLDPNPEVAKVAVNHLKRVIVAAEKLGLKNVNTFIGRDWTKNVDDNWPRFLKHGTPSSLLQKTTESKSASRTVRCCFPAMNGPVARTSPCVRRSGGACSAILHQGTSG